MSFTDVLTIAGFAIGVVGLAYAVYQGTERRRLERFVRSQAWYTYAKANNVTGIIQHAFQVYKTKQSTNLDPDLLELLSKSDAFARTSSRRRYVKYNWPSHSSIRRLSNAGSPMESLTQCMRRYSSSWQLKRHRSERQMGTPNAAINRYADGWRTTSHRVAA